MAVAPRVRFRPPLLTVIAVAVVMIGLALVWPRPGAWPFTLTFLGVFSVLYLRQGLVCTESAVVVTRLLTRRIPWGEIRGFHPGPPWRGGVRIETAFGTVWSSAPSSWWGGPCERDTIARLEAFGIWRQ